MACIDVLQWQRLGLLQAGEAGHIYSRRSGTPPMAYSAEAGAVLLRTDLHHCAVEQLVRIARTPCYFGGSRPWFLCPDCSGRASRLYLSGTAFRCSRCAKLSYPSQRSSKKVRAMQHIGLFPAAPEVDPTW